jgi:hypothetical protein
VGYARRNFMVHVPAFDDFEVFNKSCRQYLKRKLRGKADIKANLLEEDRSAMLPLPYHHYPFETPVDVPGVNEHPLKKRRVMS